MNRYGCFNTQRVGQYWARELVRRYCKPPKDEFRLVTDTSTKACQYRKTTPDPKCEGCTK